MVVYSGDETLDRALERWLNIDMCKATRSEVLEDIEARRWDKLKKTMLSRQKFGTAGLRGRMGAGYMCMNDVVVLQTAQGICSYIQKICNFEQIQSGVVIGYDGRYNSRRFAELTAKVFVTSSIPVHLFSDVCPTPLVSYATISYGAAVGIMVTASHNPKDDNGYKVYWSNGSQIIAPHDENILDEIYSCLDIPLEHWNTNDVTGHELVKDCTEDVTHKYMEYIQSCLHEEVLEQNRLAKISTVYSAMHGVGYEYVVKAFRAANLQTPISVIEQQSPNPEFPTVKFPNPEEKECLDLSKKLAEERGINLVLVNDPDADRLAVAEYDKEAKSWKVFTGNEMGSLLGWWILNQHCSHNTVDEEVYLLASFVSSKMLRAIAKGKGELVETLTGFKWMGNATLLLQQQGKVPLFAFEEAIGYMCNPRVPDKDGVSAAVQVASLASKLYANGSSLFDQLQALYRDYGYHISLNSYFTVKDQNIVQKIFRRIRNFHGPGEYPRVVGPCEVTFMNDFAAGVKIPEDNNKDAHLKVLGTGLDQDYTSGEMITFSCSSGLAVTVRTSGTEPKLKYYTEFVCRAPTVREQEEKKVIMEEMVKEFIEDLLQPEANGLVA
ncbi:Phosphoglucomutase-2 [Danaus plexippus plexippus]|uniref:Phosphoglucomutase-2 n=1 Tax=Danaus plexippus plexippus TaxID=278856 RepID=A0A212ETF5_DANPL|nr:Phosphoglucomutase-2 [Danaus plexippus plexippus]